MPELNPQSTALLAMDFQNGIVSNYQIADAIVDKAATAIRTVRNAGGTIGYVRVAFTEDDFDKVPEYSFFAGYKHSEADRKRMAADASTTQIDVRIAPQTGDIEVRKTRIGPFSTTDLDTQLRKRGIKTLILSGISTSGVVLSVVREAADLDYELFVLSDATAARDSKVHDFLIEHILPMQSTIITTADLPGLFS